MEKTVELSYDIFDTKESLSGLCPIILMHGLFWNKFMLKDIARDLSEVTQRKVKPLFDSFNIVRVTKYSKNFEKAMEIIFINYKCVCYSVILYYVKCRHYILFCLLVTKYKPLTSICHFEAW